MNFDRAFSLHNVEAIADGLVGIARVFALAEIAGRVETLRSGAFTKALNDRGGRIPILVEGEELPGVVAANEGGLRVGIACDPKKALELAGMPLELLVQGKVAQEADEDGIRSITEVAVGRLEIRNARPLEKLEAEHEARLERAARAVSDARARENDDEASRLNQASLAPQGPDDGTPRRSPFS